MVWEDLSVIDLGQRLAKSIQNTRNQRALGWLPKDNQYLAAAATGVLIQSLGNPWVEKYILGGASDFLGTPGIVDDVRLQSRICTLAEMIYNLAPVAGFEELLKKVQAAEKRDSYQAAYSEMEAARVLKSLRVQFTVRTPSCVRGESYDFDVVVAGQSVPCDAKCKVEGVTLSENSIFNPIHKANDQFPDGADYWLIMKLPMGWETQAGTLPSLDAVAARAFRNHSRLLALIFHWERCEARGDGFHWGVATQGHVRPDAEARFPDLVEVMRRIPRTDEYDWTTLPSMLS